MDAMLGKSTPMTLESAPAGSLWLHGLGNSSEDIATARTTYQQDPTKWTTGMLPNGDVVVFPKGTKVEKAHEADTHQENPTGGDEIVVRIKLPHGNGDSSDLDNDTLRAAVHVIATQERTVVRTLDEKTRECNEKSKRIHGLELELKHHRDLLKVVQAGTVLGGDSKHAQKPLRRLITDLEHKTEDERRWSEMLEENVANNRWKKTAYVNAARWQQLWKQAGAHTVDINAAFYQ